MLDIKARKDKLLAFFKTGLWQARLKELSGWQAVYIRALRILVVSVRGFIERKGSLRASALTFYSLLGIVPVLAIAFAIAKGFGLRQRLRTQLLESFSGQEEVIARVIDFADRFIETTKGGMIAGVGVIVLFWSVIKVFEHSEEAFNAIWEARGKRPLGRRLSNDLMIMLASPVVLIISGSLTVFVSAQVTGVFERAGLLVPFGPLVFLALKVLPYALMWCLLAFVYVSVPNAKVSFKAGFLGAVAAGTAYQSVQWIYITFQIGLAKYNAIYGSFAALPMFLVWLNLSWLIVLFGSQLACSVERVEGYDFDPMARQASLSARRRLSLMIAHLVVKAFVRGHGPVAAQEISGRLGLPSRLVDALAGELVKAGVLSESVTDSEDNPGFQPRVATETITIGSVLDALDSVGADALPAPVDMDAVEMARAYGEFQRALMGSPANRALRDI